MRRSKVEPGLGVPSSCTMRGNILVCLSLPLRRIRSNRVRPAWLATPVPAGVYEKMHAAASVCDLERVHRPPRALKVPTTPPEASSRRHGRTLAREHYNRDPTRQEVAFGNPEHPRRTHAKSRKQLEEAVPKDD
ncbi:hypothetical protein EYF80_026400 [Liparis tanakae]|uniref:Uncharacterized protein n=1 Tax=Liparis tanakae TaxID=230148 RepID=A0A4Z2HBZ0_9TELE|nr:hypothetical protein EYF80_026400 [Liparis tanakae]